MTWSYEAPHWALNVMIVRILSVRGEKTGKVDNFDRGHSFFLTKNKGKILIDLAVVSKWLGMN